MVFTCGLDKMGRLWTVEGRSRGALKQGKIKKHETKWEFEVMAEDEKKERR